MPPYQARVPLPNWVPDLSDQETATSQNVQNVLPRADGWGPFPSFAQFTATLPSTCRGYCYARNPDGSIQIFAGTATKLYALNNVNLSWVDASKSGGTYPGLSSTGMWQFEQFNNTIIAVQANCAPQTISMPLNFSSLTPFADLGGTPPFAGYVSIVNRFVVLSGIPSFPYRIVWSDIGNPTQWTAGVGLSDFQDLADGGVTFGIAGFDLFAVIFQSSMARLMTFAPGSPTVFTITKITGGDGNGLFGPYSWAIDQDNVFWLSQEGLKMLAPGGSPQAVGKEQFDRYIFANIDTSNLQLLLFATEPAASRLYIAFKSLHGQASLFDTVIVFDWILKKQAIVNLTGQYIDVMQIPGTTLEGLDIQTPGAVSISGFSQGASNGAGGFYVRVAVSNTAGMSTAAQQTVYGTWNITQAIGNAALYASIYNVFNNIASGGSGFGTWPINIIDSGHVDLIGSLWNGSSTYSSGGVLGGNIELITFSLDTVSLASVPFVSMINSSGAMGVFNGPAMQAIIETAEYGTNEKRTFVKGFRVISDAPAVFGSVSYRDNPQAAYNYTNEIGIDQTGTCLVDGGGVDSRYSRARLRIPASTVWTYAMAVEPDVTLTGTY